MALLSPGSTEYKNGKGSTKTTEREQRSITMGRAPCCDKANVKKGPWSPEEDAKLKSYIEEHGTGGNWIALPQKIGLRRCGKSCRLRWLNYLRPNIKHGGFSEEEDSIICSLYVAIGSRWSIIAAQLPGRTDNDIKNYWNTRLKKKLLGKQRKDHQQARRTLMAPKREVIKRDEGSTPVMPIESNPNAYWTSESNPNAYLDHNSMNLVAPSCHVNSLNEGYSMLSTQLPVPSGIPAELEQMLQGLDCLYGGENWNNESTVTTTGSESLSWSDDQYPLIYPPVAPTYQVMQQRYLGDHQ